MDQKIPFGGLLATEIPVWITFLQKSKTFRLPAFLLYAGSVKSTTKKCPGFCYVASSLPSSCFLGHVTGLFFCLYVKIVASSLHAFFDC